MKSRTAASRAGLGELVGGGGRGSLACPWYFLWRGAVCRALFSLGALRTGWTGCALASLMSWAAGGLACSTSGASSAAPGLSRTKDGGGGLSEGRDTQCFAAAWLRSTSGRAAEVSSIGWLGRSCALRRATSNDPIFSVGVSESGNGHRRLATSPAAAQANVTAANIRPRRTILVAAPERPYLIRNQSTVETFRLSSGGSARYSRFFRHPMSTPGQVEQPSRQVMGNTCSDHAFTCRDYAFTRGIQSWQTQAIDPWAIVCTSTPRASSTR